jgi:excisionase family DNA binding protein
MSSLVNADANALTLPEAARHLGVSERTIRRWVANGTLPATRLDTRQGHFRIARDDLDSVLLASDGSVWVPKDSAEPRELFADDGSFSPGAVKQAKAAAVSANATWPASAGRLTTADVLGMWRVQPQCVHCGEGRGVDHIVPAGRGGKNTPGNIQNLCPACNSKKGDRPDKRRPDLTQG